MGPHAPSDVFSLDEVARAAVVSPAQVRAFARSDGPFAAADAIRLGRALVTKRRQVPDAGQSTLFGATAALGPPVLDARGAPLAFSATLHVVVLTTLVFALGFRSNAATHSLDDGGPSAHLIFLVVPGPGGGGGGGGRMQKTPPAKAKLEGRNAIASPAPPPPPAPAVQEVHHEPPTQNSVVAPIATAPNDERSRAGVLDQAEARDDSSGAGRGGGAGTGAGTGLGEGDGSGVGPGNGGGFGGGAYRPGSGITPPRVVQEVKADYTEEARRRGVTGEVVMEIVVRRDGSVGNVHLLHGLGLGLDERAIAAVRQWQFTPAERRGVPVDVIVEVGVEFRLR
jgi:TonB family protein